MKNLLFMIPNAVVIPIEIHKWPFFISVSLSRANVRWYKIMKHLHIIYVLFGKKKSPNLRRTANGTYLSVTKDNHQQKKRNYKQ